MKIALTLCIIMAVIGCQGEPQYPMSVEFRITSTDYAMFDGYYGDTMGLYGHSLFDIAIPVTLYWELADDTCSVVGNFNRHELSHLMIVDLYVDGEFIVSDTGDSYSHQILIIYPFPE